MERFQEKMQLFRSKARPLRLGAGAAGRRPGSADYCARVQAPPLPSSTTKLERARVFSGVNEIGPEIVSVKSAPCSAATTLSKSVLPAVVNAQASSLVAS
jgi:hypothetical protein